MCSYLWYVKVLPSVVLNPRKKDKSCRLGMLVYHRRYLISGEHWMGGICWLYQDHSIFGIETMVYYL